MEDCDWLRMCQGRSGVLASWRGTQQSQVEQSVLETKRRGVTPTFKATEAQKSLLRLAVRVVQIRLCCEQ